MVEGLCLDTGALIAVERGERRVHRLLELVSAAGGCVDVPAGVVAQAWRGGSRQTRLARLLRAEGVTVIDLDKETTMAIGILCAMTSQSDVVDGHVALHARRHDLSVVTSDPGDIAAFDPTLPIAVV